VALHNAPPAFVEYRRREPIIRPAPVTTLGRLVATKQVYHVADVRAEKGYVDGHPGPVSLVELAGARTVLNVPMLKEHELIGCIALYRQEVRPFTEKQIALVQNFAAQAVIAIENARLLNELRQSLDQQTATSEVLGVISSSPGELEPVFQAMLENAVRICEAKFGTLFLRDGDVFRFAAEVGTPSALAEYNRRLKALVPTPGTIVDQVMRTKQVGHTVDAAAAAVPGNSAKLGGARSLVAVPMLKDDQLLGVIIIYRQEVRPFTEKQIELVQNFAAQAVIAIENARLLNELRQRTTDLTESLEQQTATSEVLRVISSSPSKLGPVFQTMLANATRLCGANFGILNLYEEGAFPVVAMFNVPESFAQLRRREPLVMPGPNHPLSRVAASKEAVQIADVREDEEFKREPTYVLFTELAGVRTIILIPMLKDDKLIGVVGIYRQEVRPFTDRQIALVQNFAAQAVIAIENARLLNELRESYRIVQQQAGKLDAQSQELVKLNRQLEQRVADQVGEIERMGRLRRFLPPQVADLIVASGTEKQLESHRREITALFCDLRGFTGFSESSDPEDVMALLAVILISPRVMLAVDKTITVESVGEFNLKGIRRPMAAYNVLAPSISKPN